MYDLAELSLIAVFNSEKQQFDTHKQHFHSENIAIKTKAGVRQRLSIRLKWDWQYYENENSLGDFSVAEGHVYFWISLWWSRVTVISILCVCGFFRFFESASHLKYFNVKSNVIDVPRINDIASNWYYSWALWSLREAKKLENTLAFVSLSFLFMS